jgi:hypothetical protein
MRVGENLLTFIPEEIGKIAILDNSLWIMHGKKDEQLKH